MCSRDMTRGQTRSVAPLHVYCYFKNGTSRATGRLTASSLADKPQWHTLFLRPHIQPTCEQRVHGEELIELGPREAVEDTNLRAADRSLLGVGLRAFDGDQLGGAVGLACTRDADAADEGLVVGEKAGEDLGIGAIEGFDVGTAAGAGADEHVS